MREKGDRMRHLEKDRGREREGGGGERRESLRQRWRVRY